MKEVGPVTKWEVVEYHDIHLVMLGYDEDGQSVIRRHFELEQHQTEYRDENGIWNDLNDIDDGGFPIDAMFTAFPKEE